MKKIILAVGFSLFSVVANSSFDNKNEYINYKYNPQVPINTALNFSLIQDELANNSPVIAMVSGKMKPPVVAMVSGKMKPPVVAMVSGKMKPPVVAMVSGKMKPPVVAMVSGKMKPPVIAMNTGKSKPPAFA